MVHPAILRHQPQYVKQGSGVPSGIVCCPSWHWLPTRRPRGKFLHALLDYKGKCFTLWFEPAHEIMVLFVLHKLILQTCMHSHLVGLDVWCLVRPFIYFHTSCVQTAKALARLHGCAGSPEPSLVTYDISTIISWAGLFDQLLPSFYAAVTHLCLYLVSLVFCIHCYFQETGIPSHSFSVIFFLRNVTLQISNFISELTNKNFPIWWNVNVEAVFFAILYQENSLKINTTPYRENFY